MLTRALFVDVLRSVRLESRRTTSREPIGSRPPPGRSRRFALRAPRFAPPLIALALLLGACAPTLGSLGGLAAGRADAAGTPALAAQTGVASWYGPKFAGRRTSNGEIFDPSQLTAAHRTLPFGTMVRVTNLATGRSVVVRINDRGPFKANRIIDLSRAAADAIGLTSMGVGRVRLEPLTLPAGTVRVAASARLRGYEVVSRFHPVGQLLVLQPGDGGDPVVVRVVGQSVPTDTGADVLVAGTLFARLGDVVEVRTE